MRHVSREHTLYLERVRFFRIDIAQVGVARKQGVAREGAALALIVRTQDDEHVFQCYHREERPDDQRQNPDDIILCRCRRERRGEHIEWRCANVAVDYTR